MFLVMIGLVLTNDGNNGTTSPRDSPPSCFGLKIDGGRSSGGGNGGGTRPIMAKIPGLSKIKDKLTKIGHNIGISATKEDLNL